jgi:hypothetical protein
VQYEEDEQEDYGPVSYAELLEKKRGEVDGVSWRDIREIDRYRAFCT